MRFISYLLSLGLALGTSWLTIGIAASTKASQAETICRADLPSEIEAITQPTFRRARWGILIQTLRADPETLYAQDAEKFFIPASNVKLLTTAAALTRLGANFRIRTSVYQIPTLDQQVVLRVVGRGDPSLTDVQLQELAKQLRNRGVVQIHQLVADPSYFRGDAVNPTWEWEDIQAGYGAPVNSLILNQNAIGLTLVPQALNQPLQVQWDDPNQESQWQIVNRSKTVAATDPEFVEVGRDLSQPILLVQGQLRVGAASEPVAVSIPEPDQQFLNRFEQILQANQIRVDQSLIADSAFDANQSTTSQEIAVVESPPLETLLREINQQSNNLYAEAVLRHLGIQQFPQQASSLEAGINAVKTILSEIGVDPTGYELIDGSGLSRHNLVSPESLVQTLQGMAQSPNAAAYRDLLSTAGINGTLRNRFQNTSVEGKLRGKTGALSNTVSLSGYLDAPSAPMAVSILVNQTEQSLGEVQAAIDAIIQLLMQLGSC